MVQTLQMGAASLLKVLPMLQLGGLARLAAQGKRCHPSIQLKYTVLRPLHAGSHHQQQQPSKEPRVKACPYNESSAIEDHSQ